MPQAPDPVPSWPWLMGAVAFTGACVAIAVRIVRGQPKKDLPGITLHEIERELSAIRDRLQQIPTREEIKDVARDNRHAMADGLQKLITIMIEVQMEIARLAGKQ